MSDDQEVQSEKMNSAQTGLENLSFSEYQKEYEKNDEKSVISKHKPAIALFIMIVVAITGSIIWTYTNKEQLVDVQPIVSSTTGNGLNSNESEISQVTQPVAAISQLEIATYTDDNPRYSLKYFTDYRPISYCFEHQGKSCGRFIGSAGSGYRDVQLSLFDSADKPTTDSDSSCDGQGEEIVFTVQRDSTPVDVCLTKFGGMSVMYTFEFTLGGREHFGVLAIPIEKGERLTDLSIYEKFLPEIIKSIELI